jgi:Ca2+/Na+ antiporter
MIFCLVLLAQLLATILLFYCRVSPYECNMLTLYLYFAFARAVWRLMNEKDEHEEQPDGALIALYSSFTFLLIKSTSKEA